MKSFRAKPTGWRNESVRHSLAAKGLTSKYLAKKNAKYVVTYFEIDNTERPLMDGSKIKLFDTESEANAKVDEFSRADMFAEVDKVREKEDGSIVQYHEKKSLSANRTMPGGITDDEREVALRLKKAIDLEYEKSWSPAREKWGSGKLDKDYIDEKTLKLNELYDRIEARNAK